jgi:hypothetical protein
MYFLARYLQFMCGHGGRWCVVWETHTGPHRLHDVCGRAGAEPGTHGVCDVCTRRVRCVHTACARRGWWGRTVCATGARLASSRAQIAPSASTATTRTRLTKVCTAGRAWCAWSASRATLVGCRLTATGSAACAHRVSSAQTVCRVGIVLRGRSRT